MNVANAITLSRLLPLPVIFLVIENDPLLAGILLAVSLGLDLVDGRIARKLKIESRTGIFLDPMVDKITVNSLLIYFSVIGLIPYWMTILNVVREFMVQAIRSVAPCRGVVLRTGLLNKGKLAAQSLTLFLAFPYLIDPAAAYWRDAAVYMMALTLIIAYLSMFTLVYSNKKLFLQPEADLKVKADYEK